MVRTKITLILALCALFLVAASDLDAKTWRVRVHLEDAAQMSLLPRGLDIAGRSQGYPGFIDVHLPEAEFSLLENSGLPLTVLDKDADATTRARARAYHSLAGMEAELQTIATTYPNITKLSVIGLSHQGRNIYLLEISDNPGVDEGEAEVLFTGLHHAREWPSLEMGLHICNELTQGYGSDPGITTQVDSRRIFVIPCVNPDGYYYCHDQGNDWRKNRHYFSQYGTYGVDLNRNYGGSTNGAADGDWGSIGAGSVTHYPDYETYCGPGAFSEFEAQAVRDFIKTHKIVCGLTYHTYSELVLWPWGYNGNVQTPDNALLASIGQGIASRITGQYGGTYAPSQSSGLYPTTGDTTDWAYGYSFYEMGISNFMYTIEMCVEFHPPASALPQILSENWDGAYYLLQQADTIRSSTTPWPLPPVPNAPATDPDGDYTVSWTEVNPGAGVDKFRLDELTDLTVVTDDVESGSGLWTTSNFSVSTSRYHSSNHSFKSHSSNERTGYILSNFPVPVEAGDELSFWTWYDIETNWDNAAVEVSVDGRQWDDLDRFTGNSGGWKQKTYSLDAYAGKSIFIRFLYTTDSYTLEEGFYVDDISPVADFGTVTTLSNNITGTSYNVTGNPDGEYYYRVKGHSPVHGWADFCHLDKTVVEAGGNPPVPDIKVNGSDGPLTVPVGNLVTVTIALEPNDWDGQFADWWVYVQKDFNNIWWAKYQAGDPKWTKSVTPIRFAGATLRTVNGYTVIGPRTLPAGLYAWIFAVDDKNGVLEGTYSDSCELTVN